TARIGSTPVKSAAVNTEARMASGMRIAVCRAWATGLRTKATSRMRGKGRSPIYCPRPCRKRSSSLRRTRAPTPLPFLSFKGQPLWSDRRAAPGEEVILASSGRRSQRHYRFRRERAARSNDSEHESAGRDGHWSEDLAERIGVTFAPAPVL